MLWHGRADGDAIATSGPAAAHEWVGVARQLRKGGLTQSIASNFLFYMTPAGLLIEIAVCVRASATIIGRARCLEGGSPSTPPPPHEVFPILDNLEPQLTT